MMSKGHSLEGKDMKNLSDRKVLRNMQRVGYQNSQGHILWIRKK